MSVSLEQLTQILAKVGISSSHKEEILTAVEGLITPPTTNDESTYKELCTSDDEQLCEQEIEEDNEELRHDLRSENYAYESIIERWFQAGTRLDPFNFSFYFVNLQFQHVNFARLCIFSIIICEIHNEHILITVALMVTLDL
jgi:hypothetical protein